MSVSLGQTGPLFAGTNLTICCTVTLDPSVNNNERVTTHWTGLDHIPPERYTESPVTRESDDHTGRLTISPLADEDSSTTVTCTGTVTGGTGMNISTDDIAVNVSGEIWVNSLNYLQ